MLGAAYDDDAPAHGSRGAAPLRGTGRAHHSSLPPMNSRRRRRACGEQSFLQQGITFTVYSDAQATRRIIPTDLLPRIITAGEWATHRSRG